MNFKKTFIMSIAIMAIGAMLIAGGTAALFTSSEGSEVNTFTSGSVDISSGVVNGQITGYCENMAPGDRGAITYSITNSGTLDAWVKITSLSSLNAGSAAFEGLSFTVPSHVWVAAGGTATFVVPWYYDITATNQSSSATVTALFAAVQARNNTHSDNSGPLSWNWDAQ